MIKASDMARRILTLTGAGTALLGAETCELLAQDQPRAGFPEIIEYLSNALGLPPLRTQGPQAEAGRELRIWIGFGIYQPEEVIRIVQDEQQTSGARTLYWNAPSDSALEAESDRDPNRFSTRELRLALKDGSGCRDFRQAGTYELCDIPLAPSQSWDELLGVLDSLGVESLPDEASLVPRPPIGIDGTTMVVEVRRGMSYRTYSYWLPRPDAIQPEIRRAGAIMQLLGSIGDGQ